MRNHVAAEPFVVSLGDSKMESDEERNQRNERKVARCGVSSDMGESAISRCWCLWWCMFEGRSRARRRWGIPKIEAGVGGAAIHLSAY